MILASLSSAVAGVFCCPCPGCRSHDLRVFWMWTWWVRRLKVPIGLKTANRAVVSNMSWLGLVLSLFKLTAKPQLIQPRSRPCMQSCDTSTDCLDRETYRNPVFHIFSDTFSSMGSCSKVVDPWIKTKTEFLSYGFKLLTVNHLMDWPSSVVICHLVGMCLHCLPGSYTSATGEIIVSLFHVTLQWHCLHIQSY